MGMFDSVWFPCPKCGNSVEFQTKVGECILKDYDRYEVPLEIAGSIDGHTEACQQCGTAVKARVLAGKTVAMAAEEV